ncbi:uncharacterized protein LOC112568085 isoform X8 [Pomacea canaliculata]|uniref:uncharacterized protein LOC112568085 isoform X8 n=1 Tax=Pomacea canaliculata TaxID=400727 RepID=UPI000D72FB95|nr:uncharacterized protein LOC112568085 isoform X8 [Pomacea canaliculata]
MMIAAGMGYPRGLLQLLLVLTFTAVGTQAHCGSDEIDEMRPCVSPHMRKLAPLINAFCNHYLITQDLCNVFKQIKDCASRKDIAECVEYNVFEELSQSGKGYSCGLMDFQDKCGNATMIKKKTATIRKARASKEMKTRQKTMRKLQTRQKTLRKLKTRQKTMRKLQTRQKTLRKLQLAEKPYHLRKLQLAEMPNHLMKLQLAEMPNHLRKLQLAEMPNHLRKLQLAEMPNHLRKLQLAEMPNHLRKLQTRQKTLRKLQTRQKTLRKLQMPEKPNHLRKLQTRQKTLRKLQTRQKTLRKLQLAEKPNHLRKLQLAEKPNHLRVQLQPHVLLWSRCLSSPSVCFLCRCSLCSFVSSFDTC